jgi:hypothetical protein
MNVRTHRKAISLLLVSFAAAASVARVWAYNPPVDSAGPLTVRIAGPATVTETETPVPVQVLVENRSEQPVDGRLRLQVIDRWRCEPAEAVRFTAPAKGQTSCAFRVIAGAGSWSAHYPIHALAEFTWEGKPHTAHPILILETKLPPAPAARSAIPWKAWPVSAPRALALRQIPVQRSVLTVFGREPQVMPVGWTGSEPEHRGSVHVQAQQRLGDQSRDAIAIHPPWFEGRVGTAWIEYPLSLPDVQPIRLRFAHAVTPTGEGDGVTFRVRVAPWDAADAADGAAGEVVFERHSAAKTWQDAEADLSGFAGRSIRLQLESHPGPKNNTAFDQSYWAEPTLIAGQLPGTPPFPPEDDDGSQALGVVRVGDEPYEVRVWPGQRGLLDATVAFKCGPPTLYFRGFRVRVLGQGLDDPNSPAELTGVSPEPVPHGLQMRHRFETLDGQLELVVRLFLENETLRASFQLDRAPAPRAWFAPHIEELAVDRFSRSAERVYAGHGNVILGPKAFRLGFDGHRLATSHVGFDFADSLSLVQAVDLPPESLVVEPDDRHYSLHTAHNATLTFIPAGNVWQAARHYRDTNGWLAAGGVQRLAGRFVFDLWGGRYGASGDELQRAFRYGLTDAAVVWHNWQRWGYDYRLPEIYPPNPDLGTEAELVRMIQACRQAGVLFALHDNYIDLYPDAAGFSYEQNIAFSASRQPVRAWLNEGRQAQSYRYRADRVEPFLRPNLQTIRDRLSPTAYFIDVWSSIDPYDYWTSDGKFYDRVYTRDSWRQHFAWIRELLGDDAPQISESGHDQLIGWLDGAQTNHLRVDRPAPGRYSWSVWDIRCEDAERIPWFDFAHHDRFALHGAGYSSRYEAGMDRRLHGIYSDDYVVTEVLTGHPTMVPRPFDRDVVRKYWLTQPLMRALALRKIEDVEFVDDVHRQIVRWSGGGTVWVNRGSSDWEVEGQVLPPFGYLARVSGPQEKEKILSSICRRQGVIVEMAAAPAELYVNGRQMVGEPKRIRPIGADCQWKSAGRFELTVDWRLDEPIPDGYRAFLHAVDAHGEIRFQPGYSAAVFDQPRGSAIRLPATAVLPEGCKPGEKFELRVGFYHPGAGGPRLALLGQDDGESRIRLGTIELTGEGGTVGGVRWTPLKAMPDPLLARQNPQATLIDFGPIVTAGGCRLTRQDESLVLTPLPDSGSVGTEYQLRWDRLPWQVPVPTHVESLAEDGHVLKTDPVAEPITIRCQPEVFAYRFVRRSSR